MIIIRLIKLLFYCGFVASKESSTLAKEQEKLLYGLFCNGLWQRRAECQKKGRRSKEMGNVKTKEDSFAVVC